MKQAAEQTGKGILKLREGQRHFQLTRYQPSEDLQFFIKRFWIVAWDLRGQPPYRQVVLSHPNVNLVFERGRTGVYGVSRGASVQWLEGAGQVFGVKFQPGGFYPFWNKPLVLLTDRVVSFRDMFGMDNAPLESRLLASGGEEERVRAAEQFFRARMPGPDEQLTCARELVDLIARESGITKVEELAERSGIGKRTLQRLFSRYVGVSPKWVIQRYRLQEAAERIDAGAAPDWPTLAHQLGYYDQAHFIKSFRALIGQSPEEYARQAALR